MTCSAREIQLSGGHSVLYYYLLLKGSKKCLLNFKMGYIFRILKHHFKDGLDFKYLENNHQVFSPLNISNIFNGMFIGLGQRVNSFGILHLWVQIDISYVNFVDR